jgi:hypothetical protein
VFNKIIGWFGENAVKNTSFIQIFKELFSRDTRQPGRNHLHQLDNPGRQAIRFPW